MKYRTIILLLPLMIIAFFSYSHFSHKSPPKPATTSNPVHVETSVVSEKVFAEQFETLGSLASIDNIDISSELAGQIVAIHFKPGEPVKKGKLLIQLDDTVLKSELATAKANLALSETNFKRTNELAKRGLASAQSKDQAVADLRDKQNRVKVNEAQLKKLSLRAPFSGTLGSRKVSIGQYVDIGQPLITLVANQRLRVEYSLPERFLSRLKIGQHVQIASDAFPGHTYDGIVNYIAPSIDKDTRTIAVEALIENKEQHLSPGLFVKVSHQIGKQKKRLFVPEESLIPTISGQRVFVIRDGRAVALRVETGAHYQAMTEINRGLKPDDVIIIRGQHKLKEGSHVITAGKEVS
ncbi:efflux RND transporter periplasmic adaptor subunit [Legionella spiritensis]|uniref:efflux RND transporter periplasmic adaptor subunit n=1 Tax=Legionella spiritensis TaxID=452 RepID=UPI000F70ED10|nr:efflux RND transporter periplasmic adaptor subunit [Legionella spiritensis]VEG92304.1 hemolysin D [Legionella spiritensis]